ncbi:hypothetical protein EYF80_058023 [Liparis tanakae]|uniref:Uncharacterized protein n=1 Tax=Liparis tanakae TaxID=230148 RepID=A0A4Z2ESN4_9TELE|nr:hypothetical protein EYF80_058023 [Liparis tanakae]
MADGMGEDELAPVTGASRRLQRDTYHKLHNIDADPLTFTSKFNVLLLGFFLIGVSCSAGGRKSKERHRGRFLKGVNDVFAAATRLCRQYSEIGPLNSRQAAGGGARPLPSSVPSVARQIKKKKLRRGSSERWIPVCSLIILELRAMKPVSYVETNMRRLFQLRLEPPLDLMHNV